MVFPVVMYGCESWTIKKTEHKRIELWCWRRPLRVPWTGRTSNQSILKEINPEYSLEGLMLKLGLEKAEEPEIKLSTSIGSSKKQEIPKKIKKKEKAR